MEKIGCAHYKRKCLFVSPCCNKLYICRHCHNEKENHEIDRFSIKLIMCSMCKNIQQISNECEKCHIEFAKYFCYKCNFFDDSVEKGYYHCDKCGICRVGGNENFFHCDICNCCFNLKKKEDHYCRKNILGDCPICMEDLFNSTKTFTILKCKHAIHVDCLNICLKNNNLSCPFCRKMMIDGENLKNYNNDIDEIIRNYPIQEELKLKIRCNDCSFIGEVLFHPYGMKCGGCGGYNTSR